MQCGGVCVYPECGAGCASVPPQGSMRVVSLSLSGFSFDGGSQSGWQTIGFNLDGKCTTSASTDVCTLVAGSSKSTQMDGTGGIDNSYGENICPIVEAISTGACTSNTQNVYVITDSTGSGSMAIPMNGDWLEFPIRHTFVAGQGGTGGVLAAVAPAAGVVLRLQAVAGNISTSLCSGNAFQSIAQEIEQTSDIVSSGTSDPGAQCDSISIGMTFTGSAPYSGSLPPVNNPCVADAGAD
jgi:hypothetical protein